MKSSHWLNEEVFDLGWVILSVELNFMTFCSVGFLNSAVRNNLFCV